jgi:hypothetical protein
MPKKSRKEPYSFSFSPNFIKKLKHWKNTHPDGKLSQQIEKFLDPMVPDIE